MKQCIEEYKKIKEENVLFSIVLKGAFTTFFIALIIFLVSEVI